MVLRQAEPLPIVLRADKCVQDRFALESVEHASFNGTSIFAVANREPADLGSGEKLCVRHSAKTTLICSRLLDLSVKRLKVELDVAQRWLSLTVLRG